MVWLPTTPSTGHHHASARAACFPTVSPPRLPGTHVVGEVAYLFAGETGGFEWEGEYYGHHPEFVLKGAIEELDWA